MANKARIAKLISRLENYSKWQQSDCYYCAVGCGVGLVSKKKFIRHESCSTMFNEFADYFGVSTRFADELFGTFNKGQVLRRLRQVSEA